MTVGELLEIFGEEKVKDLVQQKTAAASYKAEYERSADNIVENWLSLIGFALLFAFLQQNQNRDDHGKQDDNDGQCILKCSHNRFTSAIFDTWLF